MKKKTSKAVAAAETLAKSNPDRSPAEEKRTGGTPVPLPPYEHKRVAYGLIRRDESQPRKNFPEASLKEMADSIREKGIFQDLILEFVPAQYRLMEPELHNKNWRVEHRCTETAWELMCEDTQANCRQWLDDEAGPDALVDVYKLVDGERRWRGGGIAGIAEVPAKVYPFLTAEQRFAIQMTSFLQKENLSALEEAAALRDQLERRQLSEPEFSAEMLAKELSISRAKIYEKLKLTRLHKPVEAALLAGKISVSVAGIIATIPLPKLQEACLKEELENIEDDYPTSVRDLQSKIEREYCKQLAGAPFDVKRADYFPNGATVAYPGPCSACPHRSGNMLAEFPDLKSRPNVCTNPDCYAAKSQAHYADQTAEAHAKGQTVMSEKEFGKVKDKYVVGSAESKASSGSYYDNWEKAMGKNAPECALVVTDQGVQKVYPREEAKAAAQKNGYKWQSSSFSVRKESAAEKQKRIEEEECGKRREAFVLTQLPRLAKALAKLDAEASFELVGEMMNDYNKYSGDRNFEKELVKGEVNPRLQVLGCLFSNENNLPTGYEGCWEDHALKCWKRAGIDLKADFIVADSAAQKALPLPAKGKPEQAKLIEVKPSKEKKRGGGKAKVMSAAARAHIVAAARARWAKIKAAKR